MPNVLICIPSRDSWSPAFGMSLCVAVQSAVKAKIGVAIVNQSSSLVHANRQYLAERAEASGATHLLFLDDDMSYPGDTIPRLLSHAKSVVAASYPKREFPIVPLAYDIKAGSPLSSVGEMGIEEVAAVATGCMLIDVAVLKALPKPWFDTRYVHETGKFQGEDIYFCDLARQHGFGVYVDHDLSMEMVHHGHYGYSFKDA